MRCYVTLPFKDERGAACVLGAIAPEQRAVPSRRTKVNLKREGRQIAVEIEAADTASMRAALNSYLRWLILAKRMTEMARDD